MVLFFVILSFMNHQSRFLITMEFHVIEIKVFLTSILNSYAGHHILRCTILYIFPTIIINNYVAA